MWSRDGQQLFYTWGNVETLRVMAVDVVTEPAFQRSPSRLLFEGPYGNTVPTRSLDISPDGERFVMIVPFRAQPQPVMEINVVLNWFEELKERVPGL